MPMLTAQVSYLFAIRSSLFLKKSMKLNYKEISTLGALKNAGYQTKSIKDELRNNLRDRIKAGEETFTGVHGYENSVIPELERAILSRHNINLLGLRGAGEDAIGQIDGKFIGRVDSPCRRF